MKTPLAVELSERFDLSEIALYVVECKWRWSTRSDAGGRRSLYGFSDGLVESLFGDRFIVVVGMNMYTYKQK